MTVVKPIEKQDTSSKVHYSEYLRSEDKPAEETKPAEDNKPETPANT